MGYSPTLGRTLALGFLSRGPERIGERVVMVDRLSGTRTVCDVADPVAFDPEGGRMRG